MTTGVTGIYISEPAKNILRLDSPANAMLYFNFTALVSAMEKHIKEDSGQGLDLPMVYDLDSYN